MYLEPGGRLQVETQKSEPGGSLVRVSECACGSEPAISKVNLGQAGFPWLAS